MLCKKCGYNCDDNAQFCDKCGAPLDSQEGIAVKKPDNSTLRIKTILITACAFAVFAIGVVAALLIINNTPSARANRYLTTAEKYLVEMNYEQAVIEFQRILEIEPMNVDAYLGLAEAYMGMGDAEKALETLRKGLELTGDSRLQAKIDELTKPKEPNVSSSSSASSSSEPVEDEPPAYGSVHVAGIELDIATTESLLIYNREQYQYRDKLQNLDILEKSYTSVINLVENLSPNDLNELSKLSNLKTLRINCAGISDISFVSNYSNLSSLDLSYNSIVNITPLAGLTNLTELYLGGNKISNITPIAELTYLKNLQLYWNEISDLTPLARHKNLIKLDLGYNNQISDITPIAGLINLTELDLTKNQIRDITPLARMTNMTYLK
ncbi:MAG: leucine-rich repeat domain-containing protein, partial [Oscillospiraceae bacterium]